MEEITYPDMLLSDLTILPPSSPPIIAALDSLEPINGVGGKPSSVLEDETDIPDQWWSNNAIELITPHDRAHDCSNSNSNLNPMTPPRYKGRALVGGEGSDPGVYLSSPVLSKEDRKRKAKVDKDNTWKLKRHRREQEVAIKHMEETQLKTEKKQSAIAKALQNLEDASVTFADLCLHVFDPDNCHITPGWRWDNFYKRPEDVDQILTWMVSKPNSKQARKFAKRGMIAIMEKVVADEADRITKAGLLRPPAEIDASYVLGMKFSELPRIIQVNCPTMFRILMSIAKTCRQENECTPVRLQHKSLVSVASLLPMYIC
jgi:hypothetical protein